MCQVHKLAGSFGATTYVSCPHSCTSCSVVNNTTIDDLRGVDRKFSTCRTYSIWPSYLYICYCANHAWSLLFCLFYNANERFSARRWHLLRTMMIHEQFGPDQDQSYKDLIPLSDFHWPRWGVLCLTQTILRGSCLFLARVIKNVAKHSCRVFCSNVAGIRPSLYPASTTVAWPLPVNPPFLSQSPITLRQQATKRAHRSRLRFRNLRSCRL